MVFPGAYSSLNARRLSPEPPENCVLFATPLCITEKGQWCLRLVLEAFNRQMYASACVGASQHPPHPLSPTEVPTEELWLSLYRERV